MAVLDILISFGFRKDVAAAALHSTNGTQDALQTRLFGESTSSNISVAESPAVSILDMGCALAVHDGLLPILEKAFGKVDFRIFSGLGCFLRDLVEMFLGSFEFSSREGFNADGI